MITIDVVIAEVSGLRREELEGWIANSWVRPDRQAGQYSFADIDVARVRLILQLRDEMDVNEAALPVVLGLLDQLYDLRRRLRDFNDAIEQIVPGEVRVRLTEHLSRRGLSTQPEDGAV